MKKIIIVLMLLISVILVAETYTVKQDGTGDFVTIQDAIDSPLVIDDDVIIVYEGTYYENVVIDKNITVASRFFTTQNQDYIENTVVSGNITNGSVFLTIEGLENCVIQGFTIIGSNLLGEGILIENNHTQIYDCFISNFSMGIKLTLFDEISHSSIISNCIIHSNNYGIYSYTSTIAQIRNSEIYNNNLYGLWFDVEDGTTPDPERQNRIKNCRIHNLNGSGVAIASGIELSIEYSIIYKNTSGFENLGSNSGPIEFTHCTIYDNEHVLTGILQGTFLYFDHSIIFNNENFLIEIPGGNYYFLLACCIQETDVPYNWGAYVIVEDPLLEDPYDGDFSLKWTETEKSPCINSGVPGYSDPDGSIVDMGAIYHPCEVKTYEFEGIDGEHDGWTWLSFDILDIYEVETTNRIEELWGPVQWSTEIGKHENLNFVFVNPNWSNGDYQVISPEGFKVKMEQEADEIDVAGFRISASTAFELETNAPLGNWIGYFLEKPQHVYDAFDGYLDNIYMIKHQDWSIKSNSGVGGWPDVPYTLSPGDMVIVWCDYNIPEFSWVNGEEADGYEVPRSQSFSYTEEADYIPIYVDLDPEDMPEEIGVLLDGECKGATVVTDTLADICAYVTDSQGGNLEFEFSYGNRGTNTSIKEYTVFEPTTGFRETTKIDLKDKQDCYYVSFRGNQSDNLPVKLSTSNYPNPFNPPNAGRSPSTTIVYSLPNDGMIELKIYNIKGQVVKTLVRGDQQAGSYEVVWNGKDHNGKSVSSGVYFYKLSTKDETILKKMMLLK